MRVGRFLQFLSAIFLLGFEARCADVSYYAIVKSQQYLQTNSAAAFLPTTNAWVFDALVVASHTNAEAGATVQLPYSGVFQTLLLQPDKTDLLFEQKFNDGPTLDYYYPAGNGLFPPIYSVTMTGNNDGSQTANLSFDTKTYPQVPTFGDFDAAQSIDSTTAFTLQWNLSQGQTSDVVQVTIVGSASNLVFSSPAPFSNNALNGLSNSIVIPANSLPAGSQFQAHLSVGRPVGENTSSYPGATGVAVLGIDIQFPIITRPAPTRPLLTLLSARPAPPRLKFTGETNRYYHVQYSTNFLSWQELLVTNSPTGTGTVVDSTSPVPGRRFYRIQVGP
jgi:hypothetical protein